MANEQPPKDDPEGLKLPEELRPPEGQLLQGEKGEKVKAGRKKTALTLSGDGRNRCVASVSGTAGPEARESLPLPGCLVNLPTREAELAAIRALWHGHRN